MRHAFQLGLAAGALLTSSLLVSPAQAQHTGFVSAGRPMAAQPRATYSPRRSRSALGATSRGASYAAPFSAGGVSGSGLTLQQLLDPVPPPGFDYQYLSAVDSDLAVKAFIDPETEWRVASARRFLGAHGFGGAGYFLLDDGGYYYPDESDQSEEPAQQPAQPQPQIIVLQQAPPSAQAAQQPEAEVAPEAPLPDVGQFVLVLRNGTRIQAVAFTTSGSNIIYITADGSRRTIALADLDSETTIRVNDERGTPLQLPL